MGSDQPLNASNCFAQCSEKASYFFCSCQKGLNITNAIKEDLLRFCSWEAGRPGSNARRNNSTAEVDPSRLDTRSHCVLMPSSRVAIPGFALGQEPSGVRETGHSRPLLRSSAWWRESRLVSRQCCVQRPRPTRSFSSFARFRQVKGRPARPRSC